LVGVLWLLVTVFIMILKTDFVGALWWKNMMQTLWCLFAGVDCC